MSEENVEIVRGGFDAVARGDLEGWLSNVSAKVKLFPRPEEPGVRDCYEGHEGVLEYLANWYSGWESYIVEPERFIDGGDYVIVDVREVGVAEQSGMRVEENFAHAFKVSHGKVVEWRMFGPMQEALEAAGLSEENVEIVRTPMATTVHSRRRMEERLGLRFPRLVPLASRAIWRLPARLRRAVVRRFVRFGWEAFNRGDLDAAFMLWHPDCKTIFPSDTTTVGIESATHGRDERVRAQRQVIDDWAEFRFEPKELIDLGDGRLLSIGRMKAIGRSSGVPVDTPWATIFTTPDGRVIHEEVFTDYGQALEAAGLPE